MSRLSKNFFKKVFEFCQLLNANKIKKSSAVQYKGSKSNLNAQVQIHILKKEPGLVIIFLPCLAVLKNQFKW